MPYSKRGPQRRRNKKHAKKKTVKAVSRRLSKLEKQIEMKWDDTYIHGGAVGLGTSTSNYTLMQLVPMATDTIVNARIGNKITLKYCQVRFQVHTNTSNAASSVVRAMLILDRQPDNVSGTSLTLNTAIDPIFSNAVVSNDDLVLQPHNYNSVGKGKRFHIYYDKTFNLTPLTQSTWTNNPPNPSTVSVVSELTKTMKCNIKLGNVPVAFTSSSASSTSIQSNALYFLVFSDQATNTPTCDAIARIYYTDL